MAGRGSDAIAAAGDAEGGNVCVLVGYPPEAAGAVYGALRAALPSAVASDSSVGTAGNMGAGLARPPPLLPVGTLSYGERGYTRVRASRYGIR